MIFQIACKKPSPLHEGYPCARCTAASPLPVALLLLPSLTTPPHYSSPYWKLLRPVFHTLLLLPNPATQRFLSRLPFFLCHSVSLDSLSKSSNVRFASTVIRSTSHAIRNLKNPLPPLPLKTSQCHRSPTPTIQILRRQISRFSVSLSLSVTVSRLSTLSSKSSNVRFASTVIWFTSRRNPKAQQSSYSSSSFLPPPLPLTMQQQKYRHSPTLTIIQILRKTVLVLQREARSKDLLCPCVETQSTQKLQCLLACFAGYSLLHTTQEESLSLLCLCVCVYCYREETQWVWVYFIP